MQNVDVLIVGGGMVGLSLVCALKNTELTVAIVSDVPLSQTLPDSPTVRVSAINKRNADRLNLLGAWQHIPQSRLCAYTQMAVWDKHSFGRIAFDAADTQTDNLGHIVENQALAARLAVSGNGALYHAVASRAAFAATFRFCDSPDESLCFC